MLDRRNFLTTATTGLTGLLGLRGTLLDQLQSLPTALPDHALLDKDEDAYWAELRKQFLIPKTRFI